MCVLKPLRTESRIMYVLFSCSFHSLDKSTSLIWNGTSVSPYNLNIMIKLFIKYFVHISLKVLSIISLISVQFSTSSSAVPSDSHRNADSKCVGSFCPVGSQPVKCPGVVKFELSLLLFFFFLFINAINQNCVSLGCCWQHVFILLGIRVFLSSLMALQYKHKY
jgi:hypothetical protein